MFESPWVSGIAAQFEEYMRLAKLYGHPSTLLGAGSGDDRSHPFREGPGWREHKCSACGQVLWRVDWPNSRTTARNDNHYTLTEAARRTCPAELVG
jgi:hypothetical protein